MKLRNIISIWTAGLLLLSACTDEELTKQEGTDAGISIRLTTKATVTKAADGYEHAILDELQINTAAIAFFNENKTERVGFVYQSFNKDDSKPVSETDIRSSYEISNIPVKAGSGKIWAVVIANSTHGKEALEAAASYSSFTSLIEGASKTNAGTFDAKELVKFGEKQIDIERGGSANVIIELTQLAARIDLSFKVNAPETDPGEPVVEEKYTLEDLADYVTTKNPGRYPDYSPGECKEHKHEGKWLLVPDNWKKTTITSKSWIFNIKGVTVENIALKSKVFMSTTENASNTNDTPENLAEAFVLPLSDDVATVPFYTFEKTYNPQNNPLKITVNGALQYGTVTKVTTETFTAEYKWHSAQGGGGWGSSGYFETDYTTISSSTKTTQTIKAESTEQKTYALVFNPTKTEASTDANSCKTNGVVHGNLYDVVGTIDINTREAKFNWTLKPWETVIREVYVDIIDPAFLVVANTEMTMPNITSIATQFQSSSPVSISNIVVSNGSNNYSQDTKTVKVNPSQGNNGSITITSDLPINFVPKEISFTVTNQESLSENVVIHQYPPLYVYNYTSQKDADAGSGQKNSKMYVFKSLIANYSTINNPLEVSEDWSKFTEYDRWGRPTKVYEHYGEANTRLDKGKNMATFVRSNAVLGYPETEKIYFGNVYSKWDGVDKDSYNYGYWPKGVSINSYVHCTKQDEKNNYRISPHFVLASQNGANSGMENSTAQEFCAGYIEHDKDGVFTNHNYGSWRVPTKAELYLIDILQNTEECDVKEILEGRFYNCAVPNFADFMDARVNQTNDGTKAVRCVRDIKE